MDLLIDPRKLSADAVLAEQQEWNPENFPGESEVFLGVCNHMYNLPIEEYREYLITRHDRAIAKL